MITFQPMTDADFQAYLEMMIPQYALEKVQAGNWTVDESLERSRKEYENYLPEGLKTPGNFLFNLVDKNQIAVGFLWYALQPKQPGQAFIFDFEIYPAYRRRGYATQALAALEQDARQRGLKSLELHVFGHNIAARDLYKKAGFVESNVIMNKKIMA